MIKRSTPFTLAHNDLLRSNEISFASKGLFLFLSSQPTGWKFSLDALITHFKEHDHDIVQRFNELVVCELIAPLERKVTTNDIFVIAQKECDQIVLSFCKSQIQ